MEERLVFINKIGYNYKGSALYEFIFSKDDLDDIWGDGWEMEGDSQPPYSEHISSVGSVGLDDYELQVVYEIENFRMADAKEGIIAIAFELIDETFTSYPRLIFKYGQSINDVNKLLKLRKLKMDMLDV